MEGLDVAKIEPLHTTEMEKSRDRREMMLFYNRMLLVFHPTAGEWIVMGEALRGSSWIPGGRHQQRVGVERVQAAWRQLAEPVAFSPETILFRQLAAAETPLGPCWCATCFFAAFHWCVCSRNPQILRTASCLFSQRLGSQRCRASDAVAVCQGFSRCGLLAWRLVQCPPSHLRRRHPALDDGRQWQRVRPAKRPASEKVTCLRVLTLSAAMVFQAKAPVSHGRAA